MFCPFSPQDCSINNETVDNYLVKSPYNTQDEWILTKPFQGPGVLILVSPWMVREFFTSKKKPFSSEFVAKNLSLTFCLFVTYICCYSLNLLISELYVVDSFFFLIVKERLIFILLTGNIVRRIIP